MNMLTFNEDIRFARCAFVRGKKFPFEVFENYNL